VVAVEPAEHPDGDQLRDAAAKDTSTAEVFDHQGDHASGGGFMLGLLTGTVLGAGLGMLLAPKSGSELRSQLGHQAASMGRAAGGHLRRAGDAASGLAEKVRGHAQEPAVPSRPGGEGESA
jgi:hypothetical protein